MGVLMFYGASVEVQALPVPKQKTDVWALFHEQAPHRSWLPWDSGFLSLFDITSLPSPAATIPLVSQFVPPLELLLRPPRVSTAEKFRLLQAGLQSNSNDLGHKIESRSLDDASVSRPKTLQSNSNSNSNSNRSSSNSGNSSRSSDAGNGLAQLPRVRASVLYVQSTCHPPSNRDEYVAELMKYIPVDSYGTCLKNRESGLPNGAFASESEELVRLMAQYKFTLAFEPVLCDHLVTDVLFRPLIAGSVPVYRGPRTARDWLPSNHCAIFQEDFASPRLLAEYLVQVGADVAKYSPLFLLFPSCYCYLNQSQFAGCALIQILITNNSILLSLHFCRGEKIIKK